MAKVRCLLTTVSGGREFWFSYPYMWFLVSGPPLRIVILSRFEKYFLLREVLVFAKRGRYNWAYFQIIPQSFCQLYGICKGRCIKNIVPFLFDQKVI